MSLNFLQIASNLDPIGGLGLGSGLGTGGAVVMGIFALYILVILGLYIYFSLAFMSIGRKAKLSCPGVSWISPIISMFEISKMHWWPWPFLIIGILLGYLIMMEGIFTGSLASIVIFSILAILVFLAVGIIFGIILLIWNWKTFEAVGKPGWWAIISPIIAVVGFLFMLAGIFAPILILLGGIIYIAAIILYMVLVGIAAWSK